MRLLKVVGRIWVDAPAVISTYSTSFADVLFSFEVTLSQNVTPTPAVLGMVTSWETLPLDFVRLPRRAQAVPLCAVEPVVRDAMPAKAQGVVPVSKPPLVTGLGGATTLLTVTETTALVPVLFHVSWAWVVRLRVPLALLVSQEQV